MSTLPLLVILSPSEVASFISALPSCFAILIGRAWRLSPFRTSHVCHALFNTLRHALFDTVRHA